MNTEKKTQRIFIGFTFMWSFIFWGLGIFLAVKKNVTLLENADLLNALLNRTLTSELYAITLVNTLAGYGPLLGLVFIAIFIPETRKYFKNQFKGVQSSDEVSAMTGATITSNAVKDAVAEALEIYNKMARGAA